MTPEPDRTIVDLTQPLSADTPVIPGDPKVSVECVCTIDNDACEVRKIVVGSHTGTHVDAPAHMLTGGRKLDSYTAEDFVAIAAVVHVPGVSQITLKELPDTTGCQAVLFDTGFVYPSQDSLPDTYPTLSPEVARELVSRQIRIIGIDTPGPDLPPHHVHHMLFEADMLIVENLTNLRDLPAQCKITVAPLKLIDAEAAPCRVFAEF